MQLVINISDYNMEYINNAHDIPKDISLSIAEAILDGKVIPPHGRLIDADALNTYDVSPIYEFCVMGVTEEDIGLAPTIIEAEGSERQ